MLEKASRKRGEDYIRRMEEGFYKTSQAVQERLAVWYQRFADNNGISLMEAKKRLTRREMKELRWTVEEYIKAAKENELDGRWIKELENASARAHITRLEAVQLQMQQQAELLYQNQLDGLDRMLRETYREGYYHAAFELQKGFGVGWDLSGIDSGKLEKVLYAPWTADGLTFRDRCWRDKQGLIASLNQHLVQGCIRGETPREAMQDIARQFGVSRSKASRLIMTENAYFHETSQNDCYRDLGVEQIEIVETLDKYTCEICQEMDRKILPLEDDRPGETTPPFHPWCRGCTCPYFEDLGGERAARGADGKTYYVPSDMTYEEWKKGFVDGEKSGIMRSIQEEPQSITTQSIQNVGLVHSELLGERENRALQNANKRLLMEASRQPLGTEVGVVYSMDMKQVGKYILGGDGSVKIPRQNFDHIVLHNHPDCGTFSFGDLDIFSRRDNLKIVIAVGNNGDVYLVEKTARYNRNDFHQKVTQIKDAGEWKTSPQKANEIIDTFLQEANIYGIFYKKIER